MAIDKIKQMYTDLYNSRYGDLEREKSEGYQSATNQENQVKNNYAEALKKYEQNKLETQNKYKTLNTNLDNQQTEAKNTYYNQRNQAAVNNAKTTARTRDWLAANNLLQSGENVDAMLRANTDFNNTLGTIYTNEQATNRSINDTRNQYALDEQAAYNSINNSIGAAEREQAQKLNEILAYRKSLDDNFGSKLNSLKSEISANAIKDINAYNEQLRQESYQKQLEEERRKWEAEQSRIEWERQVEEQKRSEEERRKWEAEQALAEWNRQIEEQKRQEQWKAEQDRIAREWEAQQNALSRSYSSSSRSGSSYGAYASDVSEKTYNNTRTTLANEVKNSASTVSNIAPTKTLVNQAYNLGYINAAEKQAYDTKLNNTLNTAKKVQAQVNQGNYGTYKKNGLTGMVK